MNNLQEINGSIAPKPVTLTHYAGFWRRFFAFIIDNVIIAVITTIIYMVLIIVMALRHDFTFQITPVYMIVLAFLIDCLYDAFFLSSSYMATPGKQFLGMRVADINGNRISFFIALLRAATKFGLLGIVEWIPIIRGLISPLNLINPLLIVLTQKKQAIHDYIAGTVVLHSYSSQWEGNIIVS